MSAGMSFFILGRVSARSKMNPLFKRVGIVALFAFLFLLSAFSSHCILIFSNSTGTATGLDAIYNLIRLFIVGLGFVFIALLSILRWTLRI